VPERDDFGDRTEQPTPLRLKEARRRGQVARSADVVAAAGSLAALAVLAVSGGAMLGHLTRMTAALLAAPAGDPASLAGPLWAALAPVLATAGGGVLAVLAVIVLANLAQVGLLATAEPVEPDLGRLSISAGLRRMLSWRATVRGLLACGKVAAVAVVGFWTVRGLLGRIASASRLPAGDLAGEAANLTLHLGVRTAGALAVLAGVDWLYQRYQRRQDLKMTRREVLEDLRRMEGDPLIRRRRRAARQQRPERAGQNQ